MGGAGEQAHPLARTCACTCVSMCDTHMHTSASPLHRGVLPQPLV